MSDLPGYVPRTPPAYPTESGPCPTDLPHQGSALWVADLRIYTLYPTTPHQEIGYARARARPHVRPHHAGMCPQARVGFFVVGYMGYRVYIRRSATQRARNVRSLVG
jgi:hypothetical protein